MLRGAKDFAFGLRAGAGEGRRGTNEGETSMMFAEPSDVLKTFS